jgi:hypothetical protein
MLSACLTSEECISVTAIMATQVKFCDNLKLFTYLGNGYVCNPTKEDLKQSLLIGRGMSLIQRSTDASVPGRQVILHICYMYNLFV